MMKDSESDVSKAGSLNIEMSKILNSQLNESTETQILKRCLDKRAKVTYNIKFNFLGETPDHLLDEPDFNDPKILKQIQKNNDDLTIKDIRRKYCHNKYSQEINKSKTKSPMLNPIYHKKGNDSVDKINKKNKMHYHKNTWDLSYKNLNYLNPHEKLCDTDRSERNSTHSRSARKSPQSRKDSELDNHLHEMR